MSTKNLLFNKNKIRLTFSIGLLVLTIMKGPSEAATQVLSPIDLKSTSSFVVLAGSKVTNIPGSAITGDIGLSPAAGSNISGFGALEVTGKVYTVDATGPAGSITAVTPLFVPRKIHR